MVARQSGSNYRNLLQLINHNVVLCFAFVCSSLLGLAGVHLVTKQPNLAARNSGVWSYATYREHFLFVNSTCSRSPPVDCKQEGFPPGAWFDKQTEYGATAYKGVRARVLVRGSPRRREQLPGTAAAQQAIWQHQHPDDCSAARFFVHLPHTGGIGSQLHVYGKALALAMLLGRVYLLAYSEAAVWTDGPFCKQGTTLDQCYFEPLSNCTLTDAGFKGEAPVFSNNVTEQKNERVIMIGGEGYDNAFKQIIPPQLAPIVEVACIGTSRLFWWMRAQSTAYMMRPTERVLAELDRRRQALFNGSAILPGTVSLHVRHGDKGIEAALVSDADFANATAEVMRLAGGSLAPRVFLSTEDPGTVAYFEGLRGQWEVSYTDVPRKPDAGKSTLEYGREFGPTEEYLNALLNLQLALECDAWVGDVASNWNRLIEELRSTVRCKANGIYWDARQANPIKKFGVGDHGD